MTLLAYTRQLPAVFSTDDGVWDGLHRAGEAEGDPLWRLPLFKGYRKALDSKVADISSTGSEGSPGAITAALYLQEFVKGLPRYAPGAAPPYQPPCSVGDGT